MKMKISVLSFLLISSLAMVQCSDDDGDAQMGRLNVKVTDAPSDDANIQGTFITVSEVKVDGKAVEGFTAQTIEISAYQQGAAKLIIDKDVEAKTYNKVSLVLDYENDDSGNSPGCYVLTDDETKHELGSSASSTSEITFDRPIPVEAGGTTNLVVDFDLRKSIVRNEAGGADGKYTFVSSAEMTNAVRVVLENKCGSIKGKVNNSSSTEQKLVVFAYKKGTFDMDTETQGQGSSEVLFAKAVTSAEVAAEGDYQLAFLEEGNYEVHVASYEENENGEVSFSGMANASSSISGLLLNNIAIEAEIRIDLDISVLL
jgi:hypothetical protein